MGVVYYANYFIWMEVARTDFCRRCGFTYKDMEREAGVALAVAEASCRYIGPARYDDEILISVRLEKASRRVLIFTYIIRNATTEAVLAEGRTVHVPLGADGKSKSIPDPFYSLISKGD